MTPAESKEARYRALADPVRRRLLSFLEESPEACDVEKMARAVGLHPNTVRGHLETMEEADLVVRGTRPRTSPGRPRLVYMPSPDAWEPAAAGYRLLAQVLTTAVRLSGDDPAAVAENAGREWGRQACPPRGGAATTSGETLDALTGLLRDIGFRPQARPEGNRTVIDLTDCPFRDLARDHPDVICALHLGLMRGAVENLGGTADVESFVPFVEPARCRTVLTHT